MDEVVGLFPAQARVGDRLAKDTAVDWLVAVLQVGLDHKALVKSMFDGTVKVSDDTSAMPAHNIIVNEYDNIM